MAFAAAVLALLSLPLAAAPQAARAADRAEIEARYDKRLRFCRRPAERADAALGRAKAGLRRAQRRFARALELHRAERSARTRRRLAAARRALKAARRRRAQARSRRRAAARKARGCAARAEESYRGRVLAAAGPVIAVGAGERFSCSLHSSGDVFCWGDTRGGRLGNGLSGSDDERTRPVPVRDLFDAVALSVGADHACAVRRTGRVVCWGANEDGQLGSGGAPGRFASRPVPVEGIGDAVAVAAGGYHSCALLEGGRAACWGLNHAGQLGAGEEGEPSRKPVAVAGLEGIVELSAGGFHTCAIDKERQLYCWGANERGQLGVGDTERRITPTPVLKPALGVSAGRRHTCAARADTGRVLCWGYNFWGQLGAGSSGKHGGRAYEPAPQQVDGLGSVARVAAGGFHTCAVDGVGRAFCWGAADWGQVGDGLVRDLAAAPQQVRGLSGVAAIAAGEEHSCAALAGGEVYCWGANFAGEIGDGTLKRRAEPARSLFE